ncbi:MAG: PAS domain-containing protein [Candidatus Aureabacteria bacterium]|nr:PAS domain-containing protein [Candidatus Auribacterota bacterium]
MSTEEITKLEQELDFLQTTNTGLRRSLDELTILQEMLKGISEERTIKDIISRFFDIIKKTFTVKGYIFFEKAEDKSISPVHYEHLTEWDLTEKYGINKGILEWAINEKQISNIPAICEGEEEASLLMIPFNTANKDYGIIAIGIESGADEALTLNVSENLKLSASQAATAIENVHLYKDIEEDKANISDLKSLMLNILDSLVNGVTTIDKDKKLVHMNRNAYIMFGITEEEVVGKKYSDCFPEQLVSVIDFILKETYEKGFVLDYQVNYELIGGVNIPIGMSTNVLRDDDLKIIGVTILSRDMTASQELDRLRKLDKLKSDFVSTVSHELRSPLTTIKAYLDTLINRVDEDDKETRNMFIKTIETEANRLSRLIEEMLDLSRIESGKIQLELKYIDLTEVVENTVNLCKVQSETHTIHSDIPSDLPKVMADTDRLTQVFINLLNNSIKYSPEGKNIWVKLYEQENSLRISFKDEGLGLKSEDKYKVFEKFYRVDSQKTSDIGGTGLGLPVVKKLVEMHHGKIIVESEIDKGSEFIVVLPIKES